MIWLWWLLTVPAALGFDALLDRESRAKIVGAWWGRGPWSADAKARKAADRSGELARARDDNWRLPTPPPFLFKSPSSRTVPGLNCTFAELDNRLAEITKKDPAQGPSAESSARPRAPESQNVKDARVIVGRMK